MRILVNAISARQGGGQTYLINLLSHFEAREGVEVTVVTSGGLELSAVPRGVRIVNTGWATRNPIVRPLWELLSLPTMVSEGRYQLLFCPGGMLPFRIPPGCKTATMFRNMLPFDLRERARFRWSYNGIRLWLLYYLQRQSFRRADLVIFISQYAKSVIDKAVPDRRGAVAVIPHGINSHFRRSATDSELPDLPARYVLYVSILDEYKSQLEVVRAWAALSTTVKAGARLLFVGPENTRYGRKVRELIDTMGLAQEVLIVGQVPYRSLPAYYQNATVNLFASSCENCPNILLEAMASGRPVLSSNCQPMPEFGGDAVDYFDPSKPDELARLLAEYLANPTLRDRRGKAARESAARFDWADSAKRTWDALVGLGASVRDSPL